MLINGTQCPNEYKNLSATIVRPLPTSCSWKGSRVYIRRDGPVRLNANTQFAFSLFHYFQWSQSAAQDKYFELVSGIQTALPEILRSRGRLRGLPKAHVLHNQIKKHNFDSFNTVCTVHNAKLNLSHQPYNNGNVNTIDTPTTTRLGTSWVWSSRMVALKCQNT